MGNTERNLLRDTNPAVRQFRITILGVTDGNRTNVAAIGHTGLSPLEARAIMRSLSVAPFPDPPGTPPLSMPDSEGRN
jgi:hypothetical protein